MILSPNATDDIELKLDWNTILRSEKSVKALDVTIDYRLTFNDHISACCLKATRQLNALARISKYLLKIIFNSFIRSNFEYCPLVWHFYGKTNNQKLEKIQEQSLRILHDTFELTYEELLNKNSLLYSCIDWNYLLLRHTNRFIIWMPNVFMICFNSIILHMKQGHIHVINLTERPPAMDCKHSRILDLSYGTI